MKNLSQIFALVLLIGLSFQVEMNAQSTKYRTNSQATRLKASPEKDNAKLISARSLKEGRNFVRMGSTKLQIVKTKGRVVSIKPISNTGRVGLNLLKANTQKQGFTCIGHLCICFGDNDCNNMFTSNACSSNINDAACVDDVCVCNTN